VRFFTNGQNLHWILVDFKPVLDDVEYILGGGRKAGRELAAVQIPAKFEVNN
jgi:hypothetical protein